MRYARYSLKRSIAGRLTTQKLGLYPVSNTRTRAAWDKEFNRLMRLKAAQLKSLDKKR